MYDKQREAFSNAMDNQFIANSGRGGFHERPHVVTITELEDCVARLRALTDESINQSDANGADHKADLLALTADIANLALITAWNAGSLTVKVEAND